MRESYVARMVMRTALAAVATLAVAMTACGQPSINPVAGPAAAPATVEPEAPMEASTPETTPEPTGSVQATSSASTSPRAGATPSASTTAQPSATPSARPSSKPAQKAGPAIIGPGAQGDRVKELQARLSQVGWFSGQVTGNYGPTTRTSVSGFQGKRALPVTGQVDQTTWDRLVGMTRKPSADELSNKPKAQASSSGQRNAQGLPDRCMTGRVICISKRSNQLWWVNDGKVVSSMDVRFGTSEYPTREGTFSVQWKSRDHVSNLYHTPMPYALFFSGGQAVHYSPDFAARGYRGGSHGCVNLRNKGGAQSLFNSARVGDKVVVYS